MKRRYIYRFLEFLVVGVMLGLTEDLIAIHFATDSQINMYVVLVALIVAIPFAVFSELIVDWKHMKFLRRRWKNTLLNQIQGENRRPKRKHTRRQKKRRRR
jgi:hypothetical protein